MTLDILIPFLILLVLVVYLIYTRNNFEKNIVNLYEKKFDEWKKHSTIKEETKANKEFVGLIFKEDYKLTIELLDENVKDKLQRGKFDIKNLKDD